MTEVERMLSDRGFGDQTANAQRLVLYDAIRRAGFYPRDPLDVGGPMALHCMDVGIRYHPSRWRRQPALEGRRLRGDLGYDHREDWTSSMSHGTVLFTWHIHGCVYESDSPFIPKGGARPPADIEWCWAAPSWYWPGAIVGIAWASHVSAKLTAAIEPFVVHP